MEDEVTEKLEQVAITSFRPARIHIIIRSLIHHPQFHKDAYKAAIFCLLAEFIHDLIILQMQILYLQAPHIKKN